MMSYFLPIAIALVLIGYSAGKPYWRAYQRNKIMRRPFSKTWRKILQRRVPYFRQMPADLQLQLKGFIQVFLAEKTFVGCNGVEINDEIRVTIAAQACLLLLNRRTDFYPKLNTILVYPSSFIKTEQVIGADGVKFTQHKALSGESWDFGKIVLSWQDTVTGAELPHDGHNLVIHEFAHQLDQENGKANGAPILQANQSYSQWSAVLSEHFEQLQVQASHGAASLFDHYGATNPAEFFAVASEVFFERPNALNQLHPALYQQLAMYYCVDPVNW